MVVALANWHQRPPAAWMSRLMAASYPQLLLFSTQVRENARIYAHAFMHVFATGSHASTACLQAFSRLSRSTGIVLVCHAALTSFTVMIQLRRVFT